ncbi:hypothetical protein [Ideonella sp.]|uniref:hypothetical protein n=1 Tax=Ideonella sp. TaxID=1929293 RepID=UPI002B47D100|nr:hypothetical protein [Ideonella sp.]HJV68489.1 hypothetical protein [Ideonella sp.]
MVDLPLTDSLPAQDSGDAARRLALRVCAWQHRHPLARRVEPGEVAGLGVIALPYGPAGGAGEPAPLYHQPRLLPGLSHRALVDFAQRHAVPYRPGAADWPQRAVERADASTEPAPQTRYLLTAAINDTRARSAMPRRLLIAPEGAAIWGRRELSRLRIGLAALAVLMALAAAAALVLRGGPRQAPAPARPAAAAASAPIAAAPAVASAVAPPVPLPASTAVPAVPVPASVAASGASVPPAAAPSGPHFALVSAPAKKRAAAEATLAQVHQVLGPAMAHLQAQIMPSPEGYVVTIWPLPTQADAERLAEVLARRGVAMKWLEF